MAKSAQTVAEPTGARVGEHESSAVQQGAEWRPTRLGRARGWVRQRWSWLICCAAAAVVTAICIYYRHSWSWGDFPTWILAVGAIVTSVFAIKAFRKQSEEVVLLQLQAADQQELTRQQGDLLRVQAEQLDLQRKQFGEQRVVNERQTEVLTLQAEELSQSLDERKRQAEDQQRAQAGKVTAWFGMQTYDSFSTVGPGPPSQQWGAFIRNASDLPILDVQVFFNFIAEAQPGGGWTPVPRGAAEKIHVLPPQANRFVEIPRDVKSKHDQCDDQVYAVSIEFTDNVGVRWVRDARGALKRG